MYLQNKINKNVFKFSENEAIIQNYLRNGYEIFKEEELQEEEYKADKKKEKVKKQEG